MPVKPENVDQYLKIGCGRCKFGGTPDCKVHDWVDILQILRKILTKTDLDEEIKWSAPCYSHSGKNILMLSALKNCVTMSFFRGAEIPDPESILEKPGENSRFARCINFTNEKTARALEKIIPAYVQEAIELEKSEKKPEPDKYADLEHPEELIQIFEKDPEFEEAFKSLTPGRQRGYLIHFSSAKQSKTRSDRIFKYIPKILDGKGWNERD